MKTFALTLAATLASASAFVAPSTFSGKALTSGVASSSAMKMADLSALPGATAPLGIWDPLGIGEKATEEQIRQYELAELKHGRVAMAAVIGMLVQESFHPLFPIPGATDIGPAIEHYQLISQFYPDFWVASMFAIGLIEYNQTQTAYEGQDAISGTSKVKGADDYIIGDLGFDPLGIVGTDKFVEYRQKELNNGRLAMMAIIGEWAQELVNGQELIENLTGSEPILPVG